MASIVKFAMNDAGGFDADAVLITVLLAAGESVVYVPGRVAGGKPRSHLRGRSVFDQLIHRLAWPHRGPDCSRVGMRHTVE